MAEIDEHGVFIYEDCEKVDLQAPPKCKDLVPEVFPLSALHNNRITFQKSVHTFTRRCK